MIGPNGDQPCGITADLYRPDGASASNPMPAILTTNGFGGSKDDSNQAAIGRGFAQAGYVVLSYSGLGFGGSGCKITLDDRRDGKAGSQLVDVLPGRSRSPTRTPARPAGSTTSRRTRPVIPASA
jgi:ABC-2 type transport system ATP-binding protein